MTSAEAVEIAKIQANTKIELAKIKSRDKFWKWFLPWLWDVLKRLARYFVIGFLVWKFGLWDLLLAHLGIQGANINNVGLPEPMKKAAAVEPAPEVPKRAEAKTSPTLHEAAAKPLLVPIVAVSKKGGNPAIMPAAENLGPLVNKPLSREEIEIEILGGSKFHDDGSLRYYLCCRVVRMSLSELETVLAARAATIQLQIVHTDETLVINTEEDPTRRLRKLASKYSIPLIGPE